MIVKPAPTFQHPHLFILGGRPLPANDVEPVGVLIVKQGFYTNGTPLPITPPQPPESPLQILMKDVNFPVNEIPVGGLSVLKTKNESDLAILKPNIDLICVQNWASKYSVFGRVTINPDGNRRGPFSLLFGWRERTEDLRKQKSGDCKNFRPVPIPNPSNPPPLKQRLRLPDNFDIRFFNGSSIITVAADQTFQQIDAATGGPLQPGDVVRYSWPHVASPTSSASVTIPAKPLLRFTLDGTQIAPPGFISNGVDTVIFDRRIEAPAQGRFLLVWRFVFTWESRLELATLEVA